MKRKRFLSCLLVFCIVFTLLPSLTVDIAKADYYDENNPYRISNDADLIWFAQQVNNENNSNISAVLTADIDLNGQEWTPIGNSSKKYSGTFDGAGHSIKGMSITSNSLSDCGLFGYTDSATIKDLTVEGSIVISGGTAKLNAGGLVGEAKDGYILNCTNKVSITITERNAASSAMIRAGGICAFAVGPNSGKTLTILGCENMADISVSGMPVASTAHLVAGGICGYSKDTTYIDNCRNTGTITANITNGGGICAAGGIAAFAGKPENINNCYNIGSVTAAGSQAATTKSGAISAHTQQDSYPQHCYYLTGSANTGCYDWQGTIAADATSGIISMSEAEMKAAAFVTTLNGNASLLDYTVTWAAGTDDYPVVSAFVIATGIKSFKIGDVDGVIDQDAKTITVELPAGTDVTALPPTIECYGGAEVSPASDVAQDFTNPVIYTVAGSITYTATVNVPASGWDGTTQTEPSAVDGVYQIGTPEELAWFAAQVNAGTGAAYDAVLMADIDLNGQEWTPIGNSSKKYSGTFDGAGHSIKGMSITSNSLSDCGLFGYTDSATIKDLTVEGSIVISGGTAKLNAGGLVGEAKDGYILNCTNKVSITITERNAASSAMIRAGGICAFAVGPNSGKTLTILGCENMADISVSGMPVASTAHLVAGGICGYSKDTTYIDNCRNTGTITANITNGGGICAAGGIAAFAGKPENINNCYNIGSVTAAGSQAATTKSGAISAHTQQDSYPQHCYYLTGSANTGCYDWQGTIAADATSGIISMSEAEMKAAAFVTTLNGNASLLDYTVTWAAGTDDYPVVSAFVIATGIKSFKIGDVDGVIDQDAKTITVELPAGTDVTALPPTIECYGGAEVSPASDVAQDFTNPVIYTVAGSITYTATVTINIETLLLQGSGTESDPYLIPDAMALSKMSELFNDDAVAYGDKVWKQTANIDMTGVSFTPIGSTYSNAFTGTYDGGGFTISNLNITYSTDSAGLFGTIGNATIKNVTLTDSCSVISSTADVGGIVGTMKRNETSLVENCVNYGTVTSKYPSSSSSTNATVGGIVGGSYQTSGVVSGCSNYGGVSHESAAAFYAGGIIGNANSTSVINCQNHGAVTAPSAETWSGLGNGSSAGGITAYSSDVIVGCANTGTISGGYNIGGIVGQAGQGTVEECYNTGIVKGNSDTVNPCSIGGIVGNFTGSYLGDCYNAGEIIPPSGVVALYSGTIAGQAPSTATKAITNNYFVGANASEAFGMVYLNTAEATPLTATEIKSAVTVTALNDYLEPWSLYKVTWAQDSSNANGGYPVIQSVTAIPSFYAEIKSFSVTVDGKTYTGTIDGTEVSIVLPYGTATVNPKVTVSDKATVSPADGASVNLSSGTATYTVTAENGQSVVYTVNAVIPASPDGLAALRLSAACGEVFTAEDFAQDTLNYSVSIDDHSLIVLKTINCDLWFSPIPAEQGATLSASLNGGKAKTINGVTSLDKNGGSLVLWGPSLADAMHPGENTITLTVTPPSGGSGAVTTYTIKLTVLPTLETLSLTDADTGATLSLTPAFSPDTLEYTLDVPAGTENLQISATAYLPNIEDVILPENCVDGKLPVSGEGFDIQVGKGENVTTYHFAYASLPCYTATVALTPSDAVIAINDSNGNYVRPEADGSYKLTAGYTYEYTAAKNGYVTATGTFSHDSTADYTLTVTLTEVSSSGQDVAASDWPSFRGNEQNLGITSAFTPESMEGSELKWAVSLGTGYSNAPSIPILVDGKLIIMSSNKLFKVSLEDGSILQSADMVKAIDWGYTPATYADGMIFAPLTDGTVQAFDAETLESLWVYTDPLGGQSVSPIYYYDGYVYTGFWNSEIHDAAFICLPVTDENPSSPNEAKAALWRDVHTGGFYWAGAVAVGDYLVYGSDDGVREGQNGTSTLYSRNRITGVLCDTEDLVGDQRSSIAYADGKLYFTTKKGNLYQTALNADGTFASLNAYSMAGMATGTPVVYNGLVFANSLDGSSQFEDPGATYVLNAEDLSLITKAQNQFYNQSSLLLSTAYEDSGKLYLYGTYNGTPGGMEVLVYDTAAKTLAVEDFFIPDSDKQEYGICSPICDANGTIYFKNDSAYIFAIANKNADELAAKATEQLIEAIGTVTLESKAKIDAARTAYDALTETQKALVTNLAALLTAEAKYEELKSAADQEEIDRAAAKGVDELIDAIGEVTLESESAITAARSAYNALTDEQKARVTKLAALTVAETKLEELKADKAAAEAVEKKIADIGEVTVESENAITAARTAYDALTDTQKTLVTNLSVLTAAEAKLQELKDDSGSGSGGGDSSGGGGGSGSGGTDEKKIRVTMRLIGAEEAEKDVNLGAEEYLPNYVTWIATTSYELNEGATVYDLWVLATGEAGISSIGANNNYVSAVYAPEGYELAEFTNGKRSGWMYTVNGVHPGLGLRYWDLHDGDVVIWHYINDYSYEVADWFNEGQWQSLGDGTYYNRWLMAPDYVGGKGGGLGGSGSGSGSGGGSGSESGSSSGSNGDTTIVEPKTEAVVDVTAEVTDGEAKAEVDAEAVTEVLENTENADVLTLKVESEEADAVTVSMTAEVVQAALDADVVLTVETDNGNVTFTSNTLEALAEAGGEVAVSIVSKADGSYTVDVTLDGETADVTMKVALPAADEGQVLVVVNEDGTEEIIKKSVVEGDTVYAELPAGATVKVIGNSKEFSDVSDGAWYAGAVDFASSHDLFRGVSEDEFAPQSPMTRAMLATVLFRLEDEPEGAVGLKFGDVKDDSWYTDAVAWASENGIVNGTGNGFEPNANITREQIATMIYRYVNYLGIDTGARGDVSKFKDGKEVSSWAADAMAWAVEVGLFKGDDTGSLNPKADATRAEVATLMERLVGLIVK